MFVVTTESGKVFIEGKDVPNWDAIPKDEVIYSVMLTDGDKIKHTLTGFDFYVCCYESVAYISTESSDSKVTDKYQKLYGIKNSHKQIKKMSKVYAKLLQEVMGLLSNPSIASNALIGGIKKDQEKCLSANFQKLAQQLKDTEVVCATLGINLEMMSQDKCNQDKKCYRNGAPIEHKDDEQVIRNALIRG